MNVKNNLHTARKKAGLTQEELAHAGNISRQAYVSIESGKSVPSTEVALRIARKLHTRVEDLFSLDDGVDNFVEAEILAMPVPFLKAHGCSLFRSVHGCSPVL